MSDRFENLAKLMKDHPYTETSKYFKGKRINLITQKAIYSYDSVEKMDDARLPGNKLFYNSLNKEHIRDWRKGNKYVKCVKLMTIIKTKEIRLNVSK